MYMCTCMCLYTCVYVRVFVCPSQSPQGWALSLTWPYLHLGVTHPIHQRKAAPPLPHTLAARQGAKVVLLSVC